MFNADEGNIKIPQTPKKLLAKREANEVSRMTRLAGDSHDCCVGYKCS